MKELCTCCKKREPAGYVIINGQSRFLTDLCRHCFINNPGSKERENRSRVNKKYGGKE